MIAFIVIAFVSAGHATSIAQIKCNAFLQPTRSFPHWFEGPLEMHPKFPMFGEHFYATVYYLNVKNKKIPVVMPSVRAGGYDWSPILFHLLTSMPYGYVDQLLELRLNPFKFDPIHTAAGWIEPVAMASSEMRSIDLSPRWIELLTEDPALAIQAFGHEFGHILAYYYFGSEWPSAVYEEAARRDGNQISDYGASGPVEDWAEAIGLYLRDAFGPSRERFPHRFAFIDGLFR